MKETKLSMSDVRSALIEQCYRTIENAKVALANPDDKTEMLKQQTAMAHAQKSLADIFSRLSRYR